MKSLTALSRAAARLPAERYSVDRPVDARGQYQLELAGEFPFAVKRLVFSATDPAPPLTWHTYLELFILLSRECRLQIGDTSVTLGPGDVLVMDHLKLHAVTGFPPPTAEAIVVRFQPEIVRGFATSAADQLVLLPFYAQDTRASHVLRANDASAGEVHAALAKTLENYADAEHSPYWQTGARAFFLETLHHLARRFQAAERLREEFTRRQTKMNRLRKLFEHIDRNYAARISLPEAATLAGLSKPQFHAVFKKTTGMTLVEYLTHVRLTHAVRLLGETDLSIAEIATQVGFADQSYFDRRFRRRFGRTPREFREA
jgi:AraC-like DNA-binding protein